MTWITDNKGSGPWPFTEQGDKFGYLNNSRWSNHPKAAADPMSASEFCEGKGIALDPEHTHKPCGHWHKRRLITVPQPNLYGTGENKLGQIGLEDGIAGFSEYTQAMTDSTFTQVASGYYFSLALKSDGTLWATGMNDEGQLGLGDSTIRYEWEQVGTDTDWSYIACGGNNSFAIKSDGSLYACGDNSIGQLGLGDFSSRDEFTQVGSDTDWIQVDAGEYHMVALKDNGELWGAGYNDDGELGLGSSIEYVEDLTQLSHTDWTQISCGAYETMGIRSGNTLWGTGYNSSSNLGLGHNSKVYVFTQISGSVWEKIECGINHTLAIKTNGTLWSCGDNDSGQLALGDDNYRDVFTQIGSATDWNSIYAGMQRSAAINNDGEMWVAGMNDRGQFGNDTYYDEAQNLIQISGAWNYIANSGWFNTIAIKSGGSLFVSGSNHYGELGVGDGGYINTLTLVNEETWNAVDCWQDHTLAIREDTTLWGTGFADYGQLGFGDNGGYLRWRFVQLPMGAGWDQVATGSYHSVILKNRVIYGAGLNNSGQLGLGHTTFRIDEFTALAGSDWAFIAAGSAVTMAINTSGELFSTGDNSGGNAGQLGLGDTANRNVLTQCIGTGWKQVSIGS